MVRCSSITHGQLLITSPDFVYGARAKAMSPLFGEGIFTQDGLGHSWKISREMLRRQFARIQYQNLDIFSEQIELLIGRLVKVKGEVVDLQPLFFSFTLDTATSLLFGESAGSLREDSTDQLGSSLETASWYSGIRIQLAHLYWLCSTPEYHRACSQVKAYANRWVTKALDAPADDVDAPQYDFVRNLYSELRDRRLVQDQLVNVLFAGRDTTACLLSWTLCVIHDPLTQNFMLTHGR